MNIEINQQIKDLVDSIADIYRQNLEPSYATGNLANFQTYIDINDGRFLVTFELADYWKYVEYGRRPGKMPPIDAIEQWVKVKPVVPNAINGRVPDTRQLAFLIARKIGREGIPGKKPLTNTIYSEEVNIIIEALRRTLIEQIMETISEE
jgi:hypothetical protein